MAYEEGSIQKGASTPLRWIGKFIGFTLGVLIIILIILTPLSMVYKNNVLFSYYYSEITDPILNTGFGNFIKKGLSALTIPFSEEKQVELIESYSWKSTIDENSIKQDLGVKITSFESNSDVIETERFQKMEAVAEGYASSTEPAEIEFSCMTESSEGEVANQNNILFISSYRKESFTIKCVYDKEDFEINENKATDAKKILIKASYDFTTEAYIPIYIIKKSILDYKIEQGNKGQIRFDYNIFEEENVQDEHLNKQDGTVESVYTKGPVKLILRSLYTQPYTEEGPFGSGSYYTLDMRIDDDIQWTGNIEKINELDMLVPQEIDIFSENFEYSMEEDNFKVYKAKDSLLQELNDVCKPTKQSKLKELIDEDCWRRGNMMASLEFSINNPSDELSKTFIRAKINYKFSDEKQDTITFLNTV